MSITGTRHVRRLLLAAGLAVTASVLDGCNDAQAGALFGAGVGALAGQAIGRNTEGTLIGTAVGAGVGYIIGNESDKAKAESRYRPDGYGGGYGRPYDDCGSRR